MWIENLNEILSGNMSSFHESLYIIVFPEHVLRGISKIKFFRSEMYHINL